MTEQNAPRPEEGARAPSPGPGDGTEYEKPVVRDRRRIDPETGRARRAEEQEDVQPERERPAPEAGAEEETGRPAPEAPGEAAPAGAPATGTAGADGAQPGTGEPEPGGDLAQAKAEAAEAADQLARRNADLYNVQQEYNAYVRRSKAEAAAQRQAGVVEVVESLMPALDEIELARRHGDLTGPFQSIAEKLETTLSQRFGVERFGEIGEEFDPAVHEALMNTADAAATTTTVNQVLQPGYRIGDRVLRAARVATTSPE